MVVVVGLRLKRKRSRVVPKCRRTNSDGKGEKGDGCEDNMHLDVPGIAVGRPGWVS